MDKTVRFQPTVEDTKSAISFDNPIFDNSSSESEKNMAANYQEFDKMDKSPILPEIQISSYSFRVRELVLAGLSCIACIVCLILAVVMASNAGSGVSQKSNAQIAIETICTDPPCLKAAAYAVANMNSSIKPCDDFYEYACGNFPNIYPLDPDYSQRTVFYNLYFDNMDKLRTVLQTTSIRDASFSSERKLKDYFMSCFDDYGKMVAGGKVFIEKIIQPLGGCYMLNTFDPTNFNLQTAIEKTNIDFWVKALFQFRVVTDPFNTKQKVIEMDYAGMGIHQGYYYYMMDSTNQVQQKYKKFMRTVAKLLVIDSGLKMSQSEIDNKTETFVNDAYGIEYLIANITWNTVPTEDPHSPEKKLTLSDLTSNYNNVIDFVHFFQAVFGSDKVNGNTKIALKEHDWLGRVLSMVNTLPETDKARRLSNYLIWRLADNYAIELSWNYIQAYRTFWKDVWGWDFYSTWYHCLYYAHKDMPDALASLYVRQFFKDKSKSKAKSIVNYTKQSLIDGIDQIKFMDADTKQKAREKLKATTDKIGYPDLYKDEMAVDAIYDDVQINRSDYLQNLLNLNVFQKEDLTKDLMNGEDRTKWGYRAYYTTMKLNQRWNELLIPAGMIQFPIYEWTLPHFYNFGGMGTLVAKFLVFAIDSRGADYGPNGDDLKWYSSSTLKKYAKVEKCYANIFGNKTMGPYKVAGQTQTVTIPVNGPKAAKTGLLFVSGLQAAFKAYKKWLRDKGTEKLTPTPHYTNDQSFFLAYAQLFCYVRTDQRKYYDALNQRLPENIWVNTALSMLNDFTSAFGCPANSPMNSPNKCDTF